MMESSSKRRKIDHGDSGLRKTSLIDFESRNTTRLSTASTFVLQTDELLKESKVDYTQASKGLFDQLQKLKETIESIESHAALPIAEATSKLHKTHKVTVPYPSPKPEKDAPYKVAFEKPEKTNVVGSYVSQTMARTQDNFGVDMVVQMPGSMFQDKDYTSMRYFYRRAYYIAYIAAHLRGELIETMDLKYELLNENPLLPVLAIHPKPAAGQTRNGTNSKAGKKNKSKSPEFFIRIIPCCPEDLFPSAKLVSSANCNRSKAENGDAKKATQVSTPFYNSTLKAEGSFITYLRVLSAAKASCAGFAEACILGRIWLQQRGFAGAMSKGGFGHFEWATMMALLLRSEGRNGRAGLSTSLSGPELFKAVIQFLSDTDLSKKPFVFGGASKEDTDGVKEQGPVMYDPKTKLNLLYKMTSWSASLLQLHARSTTELLADESTEKFDPIFIVKTDVLSQVFDDVFTVKITDLEKYSSVPDRRGVIWNFSSDLYRILKRAYGPRAHLIHIQPPSVGSWTTTSSSPGPQGQVLVGIVYEFAQMSRQMEHGPPAEEQKEAAKFRQLWGEKAELRRFKNGSILECVEWESKLPEDICQEITKWVLWRHFKVPQDNIVFHPQRNHASVIRFTPIDKEAFDKARRAFQTFERDVRNLEGLPLQVRQLSPTSPFTRYAAVEPPMIGLHQQGSAQQPIDVNMYFEASSRWPENIVAIQEAKIEFLLDLDRRLTAAHDSITTVLGRENREVGMENLAYLDVTYDTGATFRIRIHCDLEETLLERQVGNKTLEPRVREEAEEVLSRFTWLFTTKPLHNQTIATFCTRLHALSPSIRLVKQWFARHKLARHFSDELVELFVLHAFLKPYPWRVPQSAATGFYRTLHFLSRWNWRDDPLVVDPADELSADDRSAARRELEGWRRRDPGMNHAAMLVATARDTSGLAYTRRGPSKLFAGRMTRLVRSAVKVLKEKDHLVDPAALFETSLRDYDVLIHTSPKALRSLLRDAGGSGAGRSQPSSVTRFKNLELAASSQPAPPLRAAPLQILLDELQRVYQDTLIFASGNSGDGEDDSDDGVIGAIWNPRLQRQKFRAGLPYNMRRVGGDDGADAVEVNKEAVLLEIARIGGDLFRKIEEVDDDDDDDDGEGEGEGEGNEEQ